MASFPAPLSGTSNTIEQIYRAYEALAAASAAGITTPDFATAGLGGKLLFAGGLEDEGRGLLFAGNIAGAASLAASADPAIQRAAIRDGVVDFLVTSLEEALRILKNEIRKRQPVSVAVAIDPATLVAQMLDRGVLPDLVSTAPDAARFVDQGARVVEPVLVASPGFVTWRVDREFARWLPRLDSLVQAIVPAEDQLRQRWLKLAPRYLGRMAQKLHGVALSAEETAEFRAKAAELAAESQGLGGQPIEIVIEG